MKMLALSFFLVFVSTACGDDSTTKNGKATPAEKSFSVGVETDAAAPTIEKITNVANKFAQCLRSKGGSATLHSPDKMTANCTEEDMVEIVGFFQCMNDECQAASNAAEALMNAARCEQPKVSKNCQAAS